MSITLKDPLVIAMTPAISMEFRLLPAGEFRMGSRGVNVNEEPIHRVRITEPFYLGIYPVTQKQFAAWTKAAKISHRNFFDEKANHPAETMTWFQASDFCRWMTAQYGSQMPHGFQAGLPTEAQWEYACRLMKRDGKPYAVETDYYTGDGEAALSIAGWFGENSQSGSTHPVGHRVPTDFGLYDMHGNVDEWCRDALDGSAYKKRADGISNPIVTDADVPKADNDIERVIRGGSWNFPAQLCRASSRNGTPPGFRVGLQGFRVCLFFKWLCPAADLA